jgi:hypothetical protein
VPAFPRQGYPGDIPTPPRATTKLFVALPV